MPETDISSAVASDLTNAITDFSVDTQSTDAAGDQKETTYVNPDWSQHLGYYKTIPELNAVIDARGIWTVGKGFQTDEITTLLLNNIKGWGADTFNTILENMIRTMWITGDAFSEIIRDEDAVLINLKPLDPSVIRVVVNRQGIILRYEQISKTKSPDKIFQPEDMFHLCRNRIADEIHGIGIAEKLSTIILMRNEAMADYKVVMHRFVKPRWIFKLDTDVPSKIAEFKRKTDKANNLGENMYIPKGAVEPELMAVAPNATLNPQAWIESLNDYFYEAAQTPKFIVGNSKGFTEASEKIGYLAFQQSVEKDQLYIEEQVLSQLNIEINLEFPASLENEALSDKPKEPTVENRGIEQEQEFIPADTTAGVGQ